MQPQSWYETTHVAFIQPRVVSYQPRATGGGNKDDAILALWSSHCRAKNRRHVADSADSLLPKTAVFCGRGRECRSERCLHEDDFHGFT